MGFFPLLFQFITHSLQIIPVLTLYYILLLMIKPLQACKRKFAETYRIYTHLNVCIKVFLNAQTWLFLGFCQPLDEKSLSLAATSISKGADMISHKST